jgi:hypothetical protein
MMFFNLFKNAKFYLVIAFIIALAVRFPFVFDNSDNYFQVQGKPYSDARQNDIFAQNWLSGKGYGDYIYGFKYHAYRVPFYSFFLAFIYNFFGHNYLVVKIIQSLLGAFSCIIIFYINKILFDKWVGLISAFLWSLHFNFILYTHVLLTETLFVFLFSLSILLIVIGMKKTSYKIIIASGILIAITTLTRSVGLILVPTAILWICFVTKLPWKKRLCFSLIICLAMFATIFPWFLRNYYVTGHPFLFNSIGALQLWNASNPDYYSINARKAWYEFHWSHPNICEGKRYGIAGEEIKYFIRSDMKGYIKSCYRRAYMFYHFPRITFPKGRFIKLNRFTLPKLSIIFTFILAPIGFISLLFHIRRISLYIFIILGYSSFYFLSGEMPRYRMPLEIIFVSFAAGFIYLLFNIHKVKSWKKIFDDQHSSFQINSKTKQLIDISSKVFSIIFSVLVIAFIIKTSTAYLYTKNSGIYYRIDQSRINKILRKKGLLKAWVKQGEKSITYNDLFQEQAKHFGHFPNYRSQIVIWQGEINYCMRDGRGNISSFSLRINPIPHNFGENVIYCFAHTKKIQKMKTKHIEDGDIIAVFGHLEEYKEKDFSFPCIFFSHLEKLR